MKKTIKKISRLLGYQITRIDASANENAAPGGNRRTVGNMQFLLEDLKSRGLECQAILDVGAHKADWSRLAKTIFPGAVFCLIEPQKELGAYIRSFCEETPGSVYFLAGAGPVQDKKWLTVWQDLQGSSFLPEQQEDLVSEEKQRLVEMVAIDELIRSGQFTIPELVKLDIQGFEIEALKGAETLFGKTDVFIIEVSLFPFIAGMPLISDVISFMLGKGYVAYDFPGFLRRPLDGALGQCDICFVKSGGFLRSSNLWD